MNLSIQVGPGRYLSPEPILSEPSFVGSRAVNARTLQAYAYANNNPITSSDPTGLYSVDGACNIPSKGKEKAEIERIANKYADKLEDYQKLCGLNSFKQCVKDQIRDVKVTCNENTTIECKKPASEGRERAAYVTDLGRCGAPTDRIFWCNRKMTADQAAKVLVHEAAHTCGWDHCQGKGVPDNGCTSDELR